MLVNTARLATITTLDRGSHPPDHTFCVMEAVAHVAGEEWSDHPRCACPVLTANAIGLNDGMPPPVRDRLLLPLIAQLVGTRATPEVEERRLFALVDAAVRLFAPLALAACGLHDQAETLRALDPIVDKPSAERARRPARSATHAANAAATAAAYAANAAYAAANAANAAATAATAAANAPAAKRAANAAATAAYAATNAAYANAASGVWEQAAALLSRLCAFSPTEVLS